jgi:hypothetical protein
MANFASKTSNSSLQVHRTDGGSLDAETSVSRQNANFGIVPFLQAADARFCLSETPMIQAFGRRHIALS